MTTYLIECYWPGVDEHRLSDAVERLAETARKQRSNVDWVSSILIPDDEIVLGLATGRSPDAVRLIAQGAGLPAERVVSCVHVRPGASNTSRKDRQ
jgi:hypothetical protein